MPGRCFSCCAVTVVAVAVLALVLPMPRPFEHVHPHQLTDWQLKGIYEALDVVKRGGLKDGFLANHLRAGDSVDDVVSEITAQTTRKLFEGVVFGAESVQYNKWTHTLAVLDYTGTLRTASLPKKTTPTNYQSDSAAGGGGGSASFANATLRPGSVYIGPGRPLGYDVYGPDDLIVADSLKGLLRVSGIGNGGSQRVGMGNNGGSGGRGGSGHSGAPRLEVLFNHFNGRPVNYVNDVAVVHAASSSSSDGSGRGSDSDADNDAVVYFTSSQDEPVVLVPRPPQCVASSTQSGAAPQCHHGEYDTLRSYMLNAFAGDATGRAFRYNMAARTTELLVEVRGWVERLNEWQWGYSGCRILVKGNALCMCGARARTYVRVCVRMHTSAHVQYRVHTCTITNARTRTNTRTHARTHAKQLRDSGLPTASLMGGPQKATNSCWWSRQRASACTRSG